jgi:hypothetical protein
MGKKKKKKRHREERGSSAEEEAEDAARLQRYALEGSRKRLKSLLRRCARGAVSRPDRNGQTPLHLVRFLLVAPCVQKRYAWHRGFLLRVTHRTLPVCH